jgi:peptidoglycan/xylan/chitin deacetylase (PgdA/CDA1 family)
MVSGQAPPVVLLYHRILDKTDLDRYQTCVSTSNFLSHIDVLKRTRNVISLSEMIECLKGRASTPRSVAITFDDGYADWHRNVLPIIQEYACPATFFVVTGQIGSSCEYWWDAFDRVVKTSPIACAKTVAEISRNGRMNMPDNLLLAPERTLYSILRSQSNPVREYVLGLLHKFAGADDIIRATHRPLTHIELSALANVSHVEFGSHTSRHEVLINRPNAEVIADLRRSRDMLQFLTTRKVDMFSYPHGRFGFDFNERDMELVRQSGYAAAFSVCSGIVKDYSLFDISRLSVPDVDGQTFERNLTRAELMTKSAHCC